MVLLIMLYKVTLTFESGDKILTCDHSERKAIEQYYTVFTLSVPRYTLLSSSSLLRGKLSASHIIGSQRGSQGSIDRGLKK